MHTTPRTVPSTLRCRLFALVLSASLCYLYLYARDGFLRSDDSADSLGTADRWMILDAVKIPRNIKKVLRSNDATLSLPFINSWWGTGQVAENEEPPIITPHVSPSNGKEQKTAPIRDWSPVRLPKPTESGANVNGQWNDVPMPDGGPVRLLKQTESGVKGNGGTAVPMPKSGPVRLPKSTKYVPPPLHPSYKRVLDAITADDKALLPKLQEEYMISSVLDDPKCGNWQNRYRELHRDIVSNTTSRPRTILYLCRKDTFCGGLADRFVGMVSTFIFALLDDRAFLAKWEVPLPMEELFDSPSVDWSSNNRPGDIVRAQGFEQDQGQEFNWVQYHRDQVESTFINSEKSWEELFPEPHLTFMTNRGMAIRLARSKQYAARIQEMGFSIDTIFGCALEFIITPRPSILQFISNFVGLFRLPSVFSVGIQIRTGDTAMRDPKSDQTALTGYEHYFKCADQLSSTYAKENQIVVYFLVTDSIHLREEASNRYLNPSANGNTTRYLLISGAPIAHTTRSAKVSDAAGSIVENWALAATNYRVISQGGYGKIAAFRSRAQNTSIVLTPTGDLQLHKLRNRPIPDCRERSAFTSFESMASVWSLG